MSKKLSFENLAKSCWHRWQIAMVRSEAGRKSRFWISLWPSPATGVKHAINVLNHPPASEGHSIRRLRRYDERVETGACEPLESGQ